MRLLVLIYKELLQFVRNKGLFIFVIYLFTADLYISANGIDLTLKNAKFYVVDEDMSVISRQMVSEFTEPWFNFQGYLQDKNKTENLLMRDMAVGVIVIPEDFSKTIKSGKTPEIALFINGTESTSGYLFSGYATRIINNFVINYTKNTDSARDPPVINIRERFLYNPNADSRIFMTITELFSVITLLALILPASAITREKENGNIEMIIISPLKMQEFLLSKIIAMSLITIAGTTAATYLIIEGILDVSFEGSFILFLLLTSFYVFTASGISMLISSISKNMLQVSQITIMVLLPMLFLSGSWTPYESMPVVFQKLTYISPLKYYLEGSFDVILKGLGFGYVFTDFIGIIVLGIPTFIAGAYFLVKKI